MFRIRNKSFAPTHFGLSIVAASLLFISGVSAAPPEKTNVIKFGTGPVGEAMLVRTPNGVHVKIWTTQLEPSSVYTMWWAIDVGGPDFCVMWGAGHPIGPNGTGYFAANLNEGEEWDFPRPDELDLAAGPCDGLKDAENQRIWVLLRTHGPIIPGLVDEQMSTYLGGCIPDRDPENPPDPDDPHFCEDQQIAFFADP